MRNSKMLLVTVSLFVFATLMFGACGGKNIKEGGLPKWYLNPPESKTIIYGTGASEKTASIELGKQVADANARTDLAATIQVSVQAMVRTFLQQSGTLEDSRALQFAESVSKNVVDIKLTGVKISDREVVDGRMYSLAQVSYDSMKNALLSAVRDAAAEMSEAKAKNAFQDLDKAVRAGKEANRVLAPISNGLFAQRKMPAMVDQAQKSTQRKIADLFDPLNINASTKPKGR